MEIDHIHPEFAVWHLAETPVRRIPFGALLKWYDGILQYGFHLGSGVIASRDGLILAESLDTDPGLPWKKKTCVLAQEGRVVVFGQPALRARDQAGRFAARRDFISACLGEELADWGDFPVWIFARYGKCFLHPVTPGAVYDAFSIEEK